MFYNLLVVTGMAKLIIKWLKIYSGKNITSVPCGQIASKANSIIDALYLSRQYDIWLER